MKWKNTCRFPPIFCNFSLPCNFLKFGISNKSLLKISKIIELLPNLKRYHGILMCEDTWLNPTSYFPHSTTTFWSSSLVLFSFWVGLGCGKEGENKRGQMKRKHDDVEKTNPRILYTYNKQYSLAWTKDSNPSSNK